jgi:hypothetical protein
MTLPPVFRRERLATLPHRDENSLLDTTPADDDCAHGARWRIGGPASSARRAFCHEAAVFLGARGARHGLSEGKIQ